MHKDENLNKLKPGLYCVSTPIGNLGDITFRAVEVLKRSDLILCEDTRVSKKLLLKFDIDNEILSLQDNEIAKDIKDSNFASIKKCFMLAKEIFSFPFLFYFNRVC